MRVEAITVPNGIVLRFGGEASVSLLASEIKNLGLQETVLLIVDRLEAMAELRDVEFVMEPVGIVESEIVEPTDYLDIELDGDEDDEDISDFEEVVEAPWSYLVGRGII